jgi:hypothetical protein
MTLPDVLGTAKKYVSAPNWNHEWQGLGRGPGIRTGGVQHLVWLEAQHTFRRLLCLLLLARRCSLHHNHLAESSFDDIPYPDPHETHDARTVFGDFGEEGGDGGD